MLTADEFRDRLLTCLGGPWPEPTELHPTLRSVEQLDGFRRETWTYLVEPGDRVAAHLLVPESATRDQRAPGICVWHQHNGAWHIGKTEPAGLGGSEMHHTGVALARLGYVVLCPDALCFGERQSTRLRGGDFERYEFLRYVVAGRSMAWKNILDMRRAVDFLVSRAEVNPDLLGCYGHSMGSTHTWLVGPWEPRLKCLVGNCCLPTYASIERTFLLHCFPNFIPGLAQYGDTPDLAALIAPRPLLLNFGELDTGSPIEEVRAGIDTIQQEYRRQGVADRFRGFIEPGVGHELTPAMWANVRDWFARFLPV